MREGFCLLKDTHSRNVQDTVLTVSLNPKVSRSGEMVHRLKGPAAKFEDLSLSPGTHRVDGENPFLKAVS